ncbi:DUF2955 domain-containing protein [Chitinibacter sp. SCUT-21]|uniref:DUF2955 domain-containing protein n=1 Tax=Chitinibacter sp. SCUT-21 TaxID=2970891 RepID=UPI0035A6B8D6
MFTKPLAPMVLIDDASRRVLRLVLGVALALVIAYGFGLAVPHLSVLIVLMLLSPAGPPLNLIKGAMLALVLMVLTGAGIVLVPLLQHYAYAAILLIIVALFAIFFLGIKTRHPLLNVLLMTFTMIPVAGLQSQALVQGLVMSLAGGVLLASFCSMLAHLTLPDLAPAPSKPKPAPSDVAASWLALQGVVIIVPVLLLALANPALYLAAIMKTATLGQQASRVHAKEAARELLGSTLLGALLASLIWAGLSLSPTLWMFTLWVALAFLWMALRFYRVAPSAYAPSYWLNVMITVLIFLGPAVQDSANGKDVLSAALIRLALFVAVAIYACVSIYALEALREWVSKRR